MCELDTAIICPGTMALCFRVTALPLLCNSSITPKLSPRNSTYTAVVSASYLSTEWGNHVTDHQSLGGDDRYGDCGVFLDCSAAQHPCWRECRKPRRPVHRHHADAPDLASEPERGHSCGSFVRHQRHSAGGGRADSAGHRSRRCPASAGESARSPRHSHPRGRGDSARVRPGRAGFRRRGRGTGPAGFCSRRPLSGWRRWCGDPACGGAWCSWCSGWWWCGDAAGGGARCSWCSRWWRSRHSAGCGARCSRCSGWRWSIDPAGCRARSARRSGRGSRRCSGCTNC